MKKILALVIDDEEDIRDVVADKLAAMGHDHHAVGNCQDAIAKVKTGSSGFHQDVPKEDVIITKAEVIQ